MPYWDHTSLLSTELHQGKSYLEPWGGETSPINIEKFK